MKSPIEYIKMLWRHYIKFKLWRLWLGNSWRLPWYSDCGVFKPHHSLKCPICESRKETKEWNE